MTPDEIIEMAEEAGVAFASDDYPEIWATYMHVGKKELVAFANFVAAKALAEHAMRETQRLGQEIEQEPVAECPNLKGENMNKDEALTLEALKFAASKGYGRIVHEMKITPFTIKYEEALAQPEQEPVQFKCTVIDDVHPNGIPLEQWTPPPQRKPLTNGEIYTAYITATNQTLRATDERLAFAFARAIEAAHDIKGNT